MSSPSATPFAALLAHIGLALKAVVQNDTEGATEQYKALKSQRGTVFFLSADRLLGLLAQTMGQRDVALTHFEEALKLCRRAEYRPELAWSAFDYAETILTETGGGTNLQSDHERVMALLDEALGIAQEVGMQPLMERVLARRASLSA